MYNVVLTDDNFIHSYAKVGKLNNGIDVDKLPDYDEQTLEFYSCKLVTSTVDITNTITVIEKYIVEYKEVENTDDETGETYTETVPVERIVTDNEIESEEIDPSIIQQRIKTDENGNPVTREETVQQTVYDWEFDETKYNQLLEESKKEIPEYQDLYDNKEMYEQIQTLTSENESLKEQVSVLDSTLTVLLEDILPSMTEEE